MKCSLWRKVDITLHDRLHGRTQPFPLMLPVWDTCDENKLRAGAPAVSIKGKAQHGAWT